MKHYIYYLICASLTISRCAADETTTNWWGPETNGVRLSIRASQSCTVFSGDDIMDLPGLIARLVKRSDEMSAFVWQCMSKEEQTSVSDYDPSAPNAKRSELVVVQVLNRIVEGSCIYTPERFRGLTLGEETESTIELVGLGSIGQVQAGPFLEHFNRLLLEDAYPLQLSSKLRVGEPAIKATEPVEVMITFTNISSSNTFFLFSGGGIVNDPAYTFLIVSPSGKEVSLQGKTIWGSGGSGANYALPPNRMRQWRIDLRAIYNFDEIGRYIITIKRIMRWPDERIEQRFTVISNPSSIRIVADTH